MLFGQLSQIAESSDASWNLSGKGIIRETPEMKSVKQIGQNHDAHNVSNCERLETDEGIGLCPSKPLIFLGSEQRLWKCDTGHGVV